MKTRAELKAAAKQQIKGNIGGLFLLALVIFALAFISTFIPFAGLLLTPALTFSTIRAYYKLSKDSLYKPSAGDAFLGFENFSGAFKVYWAQGIFTFLWSLLLVIPGIIKSFAYSQAMYILEENPEISGTDAIKKSSEMMNGHKMEYFILQLSFIGWHILAGFTFGILYIWLIPYMNATNANFYQSIKPQETYSYSFDQQ